MPLCTPDGESAAEKRSSDQLIGEYRALSRQPGAVACFGERPDTDDEAAYVTAIRSLDGGLTWSPMGGEPGDEHLTAFSTRSLCPKPKCRRR